MLTVTGDSSKLTVVNNLPDGVLLLDTEGWVVDADGGAAELLGQPVGELTGCAVEEALDTDDDSTRSLAALVEPGSVQDACDLRVWRRDGGWRWLRASVSPGSGEASVQLRLTDVTDRHRASQPASALVGALREPVLIFDRAGAIRQANDAAVTFLGLDSQWRAAAPDALLDRFVESGEPSSFLRQPVERCILTGLARHEQIVEYRHPDGSCRRLSVRLQLLDDGGDPLVAASFAEAATRG